MDDVPHRYSTFVCAHCGHQLRIPVRCGNRFCPVCGKRSYLRARHRMEEIIKFVSPRPGDSVKFLTLTIPSEDDPRAQLESLRKSFKRLRSLKWWKNRVRGGYHVFEMTRSNTGKWHVHLHAIIESAYLPVLELAEVWRRVSPGQIVYIQRIPIKQAIFYVTKYVTKTSLPLADQIVASDALRSCRLYQPFGLWYHLDRQVAPYRSECPTCGHSCWVYLRPGIPVGDAVGAYSASDPSDQHPRPPPPHQYTLLPSSFTPPE